MTKLNHKRRKKMRRKIMRSDVGWEQVLAELVQYEIINSVERKVKK